MYVFIDFARLQSALRCCRNAVFMRLRASHGTGLVVVFIAGLWCSAAVAQPYSSDDIARAVKAARYADALGLFRPSIMESLVTAEEKPGRIDEVLRILGVRAPGDPDLRSRIAEEIVRQDALEKLFGFKFGIGASITTNRRNNAIKDAVVDSKGIVRVTREDDTSVGYLLEAHYFFVPNRPFLNLGTGNWGIGPFVAVQAGNEKALSGLGFGLMIGFRQPSTNPTASTNLSWNFGIGAIYDPGVKVLGNGIIADRPLPAGEATLRTTEVGSWGLMLMSSFNF